MPDGSAGRIRPDSPVALGVAAGAAVEVQRMHRGIRYCKAASGGEKNRPSCHPCRLPSENQKEVDDQGAAAGEPKPSCPIPKRRQAFEVKRLRLVRPNRQRSEREKKVERSKQPRLAHPTSARLPLAP